MEFVKKEQSSNKTKDCYFLKNVNEVDRKMLKKMGFKYKDEQEINNIECEVWARRA